MQHGHLDIPASRLAGTGAAAAIAARSRKSSHAATAAAAARPPPWRDTMLRAVDAVTGTLTVSIYVQPREAKGYIRLISASELGSSVGSGAYVEVVASGARFLSSTLPRDSEPAVWGSTGTDASWSFDLPHSDAVALIKGSSARRTSSVASSVASSGSSSSLGPSSEHPGEASTGTGSGTGTGTGSNRSSGSGSGSDGGGGVGGGGGSSGLLMITVWGYGRSDPPQFVGHVAVPFLSLPLAQAHAANTTVKLELGGMSVRLLEWLSHSILHVALPDRGSSRFKNTSYHQVLRSHVRSPIDLPEPICKRDAIAFELYTTEVTYLNGLSVLANELYGPLLAAAEAADAGGPTDPYSLPPMIPRAKLKLMAANIDFLLKGHTALLNDLESRIARWSATTSIGDLFAASTILFSSYAEYCAATELALNVLTASEKSSSQFYAFDIQACRYHGGSNFRSLVILPVQRLPRYRLLLADLVKATPKQHPDTSSVSDALGIVSKVTSNINRSLKAIGDIKHLKKAGIPHYFAPGRRFISKAPLSPRSLRTGFFGILCSDALFIGFQESRKKPVDVQYYFPLATLWVMDLEDLDPQAAGSRSFELYNCESSVFVYVDDEAAKLSWIQELRIAIADALNAVAGPGVPAFEPKQDQLATRPSAHFYFADGSIYMGSLCNGERAGIGTYIEANGNQYDGSWFQDMRHGQGRQSFASPSAEFAVLEGEFFHDVFLSTTASSTVAMPKSPSYHPHLAITDVGDGGKRSRASSRSSVGFLTPELVLEASRRNPLCLENCSLDQAPAVPAPPPDTPVLARSTVHIQAISPSNVVLDEGGTVLANLRTVNGQMWFPPLKAAAAPAKLPLAIEVEPSAAGLWLVHIAFYKEGVFEVAVKNGSHLSDVLAFDVRTRVDGSVLVKVSDVTFPFRQALEARKRRPPPKPSQPPRRPRKPRPPSIYTAMSSTSGSDSYYSYSYYSSSSSSSSGSSSSSPSPSTSDVAGPEAGVSWI